MSSARSITTGDLATLLGAQLIGPGSIALTHIDSLDAAGPGGLSFIRSARFARQWNSSKAGAALVNRDVPLADIAPDPRRALLVVPDADLAIIKALEQFAPAPEPITPGIHPLAFIDPAATISPTATIGPFCTINAGAAVGDHTLLTAHVYLGAGASVGSRCTIHSNVSILDRCTIGNHCILHSGVVIGADGFGYRPSPDGRGLLKIPHHGGVTIGDHVEIGANSCVDRAKFGATTIGAGTKIDNLVQIGHGCRVGRSSIICGHVGLSGSVIVGDGVIIGGMVGIADNVEVGDGAKIAAFSGVAGNVPAGAVYMGAPAGPAGEWRRTYAAMRRIGKRKPGLRDNT